MASAASLAVGALLGKKPEAEENKDLSIKTPSYDTAMKDILERVKDIDISATTTSSNSDNKVRKNSGSDICTSEASTNESTAPEMPEIPLAEVGEHCSFEDAWIVFYDKVYDITNFLHEVCF